MILFRTINKIMPGVEQLKDSGLKFNTLYNTKCVLDLNTRQIQLQETTYPFDLKTALSVFTKNIFTAEEINAADELLREISEGSLPFYVLVEFTKKGRGVHILPNPDLVHIVDKDGKTVSGKDAIHFEEYHRAPLRIGREDCGYVLAALQNVHSAMIPNRNQIVSVYEAYPEAVINVVVIARSHTLEGPGEDLGLVVGYLNKNNLQQILNGTLSYQPLQARIPSGYINY